MSEEDGLELAKNTSPEDRYPKLLDTLRNEVNATKNMQQDFKDEMDQKELEPQGFIQREGNV